MKLSRIIAMFLIIALSICSFAACSDDKSSNDGVQTDENGDAVIENNEEDQEVVPKEGEIAVTVQIKTDEFDQNLAEGTVILKQGANVLEAINAFCAKEGIECTYEEYEEDEAPDTVFSMGDYKATAKDRQNTAKFIYYWQALMADPATAVTNEDGIVEYAFAEIAGTAVDNEVYDGCIVRYNYTSIPNGPYVYVSVVAQDEFIIEKVIAVYEDGDSLQDAVAAALGDNDIDYSLSETSIQSIDDYLAKKTPIYEDIWEITAGDKNYTSNDNLSEISLIEEEEIVVTFKRIENETVITA